MIAIGRLLCATRVLLSQVVLELTLYDRRRVPSFGTSKRYTRAVLPPAILATAPDILVELELHAARSVGTGTMRSRAASAPQAMAASTSSGASVRYSPRSS